MSIGLSRSEIERRLTTMRFGRLLRVISETGSTNTDALVWADEGAPEGAVVVAERQTKGRGRFERVWESNPRENLTFSVVLRPRFGADRFGLIGIAAAVAVANCLHRTVPSSLVRIKWPNDILIGGRKCCGILSESRLGSGESHPPIALGIGINVNQVAFSESIRPSATSLYLESGAPIDRHDLLGQLLAELESVYDVLSRGDAGSVRSRYMSRLQGIHEEVALHTVREGYPIVGRLVGIDESGALRLRIGREEQTFHAGELTFRSPT